MTKHKSETRSDILEEEKLPRVKIKQFDEDRELIKLLESKFVKDELEFEFEFISLIKI